MTFRQCLARSLNKAAVWFLVIVCATVWVNGQQENKVFNKPEPVGTITDVLNKNTCKDVPAGEIPGAVILREIGGGFIYSTNPVRIGKALDEEFAGKDWPKFEVRYFCR